MFTAIYNFFSSFITLFSSPAAAQAAANIEAVVETVSEAIVCDISAGAGLAESIMQQVNAGQSISGTTNEIYVISSAVCGALKGSVVAGKTGTNVPAITSVTPATS